MAGRIALILSGTALAVLAGCADGPGDRPRAKPEKLAVNIVDRAAGKPKLTRAHISTKSGDILILEKDGSVSSANLDSPSGKHALDISEADLASLNVNLGLDLSHVKPVPVDNSLGGLAGIERGPTEQERALADFAARTQPALPAFPAGFKAARTDFQGAEIRQFAGDKRGDLIQVTANLRAGVDDSLAFAYATCALAGWAQGAKIPYARHIMTTRNKDNGLVKIAAVYTLSQSQPMGLRVMETTDTLRSCRESGIPAATGGTSKHG